jgi:hypothetical protein
MKRLDKSDEQFLAKLRTKSLRVQYFESLKRERKFWCILSTVSAVCMAVYALPLGESDGHSELPMILFAGAIFLFTTTWFGNVDRMIKLCKLFEQETTPETEHQNAELSPAAVATDEA